MTELIEHLTFQVKRLEEALTAERERNAFLEAELMKTNPLKGWKRNPIGVHYVGDDE